MRRLWLLFAQTVTVCLGILFIVATLRPDWLHSSPSGRSAAPQVSAAGEVSYAKAVALATPAVVNVYTSKKIRVPVVPLPNDPELNRLFRDLPGFSRRKKTTNLGSGVIVRADGYVLTNYHVIEAADSIQVALSDGRQAAAKLVGADPDSDLAVLKIDLPNLSAITFNSERHVQVGDVVLAIGNPFGVGQTTTMGIVSALGRNRLGINIYENFIQTDAAINPGNSGGALIDTTGRLVGINTAIYSENGGSLGIGFAIPAEAAHKIMEQIIATGSVTRGWLGIEPQDITPDLARAFNLRQDDGVIIASVLKNGPAGRAGIRVGDIVLKINDQPVYDTIGFLNQIAPLPPRHEVTLTILRGGRVIEQTVQVGTRPRITKP
ncbi:trypsin-like peptidase domain-containing protein [Paralcaligenes sp. KSB-10]|uniref:S1C family serine protease n=1 Tax=Paralcaligenes sp. KSB-10 TaxID=2901142 RepID=UPI001E659EFF|nr:trypsin-like peptidase domain-containing protein [Paralcaligenes sp. KSB-10]UHL63306.1 trypsin-like peptidase domain-containing protein [Paralcaligenes sp. KSB-10]